VPPAPEFYGMHALNTLHSDLNAVTVRSKLTIAILRYMYIYIFYSFQKHARAWLIRDACSIAIGTEHIASAYYCCMLCERIM
jgi:hypothetical protein